MYAEFSNPVKKRSKSSESRSITIISAKIIHKLSKYKNKKTCMLVIVPLYAFTGNPLIFNSYLLTCEEYSSANFNPKLCSKHSILTHSFSGGLFGCAFAAVWPER